MSEQEIIKKIERLKKTIDRLLEEDDSNLCVMGSELNKALDEELRLISELKGYEKAKQELKDTLIVYEINSIHITTIEDYKKMERENFKTIEIYPRTDCTLWG